MPNDYLNNNDKDLQLARFYGEILEGKKSLSLTSDPLIDVLITYKKEKKGYKNIEEPRKDEIWYRIKQKMKPEKTGNPEARTLPLYRSPVWAVAALILLACFSGLFYYFAQPVVVGRSDDAISQITLKDGSEVTLRPHSTLYKSGYLAFNNYKYNLNGEAFFKVVRQKDGRFSVKAGNGIVRVLGTKFNLSSWGEEVSVYLQEGKVQVENEKSGSKTVLNSGQVAWLTGESIVTDKAKDVDEFTDWMREQLIFKNRTVQYLFNELEQHFKITLKAPDKFQQTRLTGELVLQNLQQTLTDLELVLDGTFIRHNEKSYTFKPN